LHYYQDETETEFLQNHSYVILELPVWDYFNNNDIENSIVKLYIQNMTAAEDLIDIARIYRITPSDTVQNIRRDIFHTGILPSLFFIFGVNPSNSNHRYQHWHTTVKEYINAKLNAIINEQLDCHLVLTTTDIGVNLTFYPLDAARPILNRRRLDNRYFISHVNQDPDIQPYASAAVATSQIISQAMAVRSKDPPLEVLGDPSDLSNYLPDSGATQHMTPRLADLFDVEGGQNLGVEVADGHIIKCTTTGKIAINMTDDNNLPLKVTLTDVMYVPGLSRRLFSITKFAKHGHYAVLKGTATTLNFAPTNAPVTLSSYQGSSTFAADVSVHDAASSNPYHDVPSLHNRNHSKSKNYVSLELLHRRLGHRKCRTLLAANEHHLWEDTMVRMSPEAGCLSCGIATIKASVRNKEHHTAASYPGEYVFLDILHPITQTGLTSKTSYAFYLIVVDAYSRFCSIHGLPDKSTTAVIQALLQYQADFKPATEYGFVDLKRIRSDSGSQFTSDAFADHCRQAGIALSLLVHARLPDSFWFHGLLYAAQIFNVLPIRGLTAAQSDIPTTPWQLFYGSKPLVGRFRIFGCPVVIRRWTAADRANGKQTERGIRGIFVGFSSSQKGSLVFTPGSRQLVISDDIIFDENFYSAVALTWQQHKDSLSLQPALSDIPTVDTPIAHTGSAADLPDALRSSAAPKADEDEDDNVPDLVPQEPDDDLDEYDDDVDDEELSCAPKEFVTFTPPVDDAVITPLPAPEGLRRSTRVRRLPARFANAATASDWSTTCSDAHLASACAAEAHPAISMDEAHLWEPAPRTIRDIMTMKDPVVKSAWLASVRKELKTLVDANTFTVDTIRPDEVSTPIMETFKVKIKSDGSLDKLKTQLVVRKDLQNHPPLPPSVH